MEKHDTMKWPREEHWFRHGQSERNVRAKAAKQAGGAADYSEGVRDQDTRLTDVGYSQVEATGDAYGKMIELGQQRPFDVLLVSPYLRTRQSAERFVYAMCRHTVCGAPIHTPKIVIEERIREIEFGILDGLTPEGIKAKYPEEIRRKAREGKYFYRAPGGENRPDVRMRLRSVFDTSARDYVGKVIGFWCHSVVVMAARSLRERWEEAQYLQVDKENDVLNSSVTKYEVEPGDHRLLLRHYNKVYYAPHEG